MLKASYSISFISIASNVLVLVPANQLPFPPWQTAFPNEARYCRPPFILIKTAQTVSTWCAPAAQHLSCITRFLLSSVLIGATIWGNQRKRMGDSVEQSLKILCNELFLSLTTGNHRYNEIGSFEIYLQSKRMFVTAYVKTPLIRDFLSFQRTSL